MPDRDYLFVELTNSICSQCLHKVEAKVIVEPGERGGRGVPGEVVSGAQEGERC